LFSANSANSAVKYHLETLFFFTHRRVIMKSKRAASAVLFLTFVLSLPLSAAERKPDVPPPKVSPETEACLGCHSVYTPGIVQDWMSSRHAKITPADARRKPENERRVSAASVPDTLAGHAVGCYECHSLNAKAHKDNFEHMGFRINVVVSPEDCRTCHPDEVTQYHGSKKAYAYRNLMQNPVYHTLVTTVTGLKKFEKGALAAQPPTAATLHETCLGCHGTVVEVKGLKTLKTVSGEITVPDLTNWPNTGVGRINPDGSLGACTACHPRHGFSIEIARKPYTCAQCHLEPDVPAWNVYKESKHGNIYASEYHEWDFDAVPWTMGRDFKAPTCAVCHNSLVVAPDGRVIAERSHDFGSRLWVRLFGLVYSHAQPVSGDTTIIRNKDGLPLPTAFTGEPASKYLIDASEQTRRLGVMKSICNVCHGTNWVNGHFDKLAYTIRETDAMTAAATTLMADAWNRKIEDNKNPFDEPIEQRWVKQWLFYANSVRYASAMSGAPDYAAFKNGWWELTNNLAEMRQAVEMKSVTKKSGRKGK
jgi:hypothetical protein